MAQTKFHFLRIDIPPPHENLEEQLIPSQEVEQRGLKLGQQERDEELNQLFHR
jgi:hypothetical protein